MSSSSFLNSYIHSEIKSKNTLNQESRKWEGKIVMQIGHGHGHEQRALDSLYTQYYQLEFYEWISIWFK